jgi:uncharacterized protein
MRIRHVLFPAIAIILTACTATPQAAAQNEAPFRTITVNGEGAAIAAPDMAIVSIGVRTDAKTAAAALRQNSGKMAATIKKLKDLDIADRDLQTSGLSVSPRYDYGSNRSTPNIIGFTAANTLTVKLRDLDNAGAVIDQAVQAGANSLGGIQFTFADPKPLRQAARKDAVKSAQEKAKLYADSAGVSLGRVMTIQDGYTSAPSPQPVMARMSAEQDASVPLQAGESSINATVTIVYAIE